MPRPCLSRNFACLLVLSGEMPTTTAPAASNFCFSRVKSNASAVQPDVSSFG